MASSSTQAGPSKRKKSQRIKEEVSSSTLPGVQKIKSALRQTRRLLGKDNLAADVRVETERRLKSLQADLDKAERSRRERQYAIRYHKVKFFERQKVCRKIKQLKKALEDPDTPEAERDDIRQSLYEKRIDLNYILHYPKTQKYVSLFPTQPSEQTQEKTLKTTIQRTKLRQLVKTAMEKGELDGEPELTIDRNNETETYAMDWEAINEESLQLKKNEKQKATIRDKAIRGISDDEFFAGSDEGGR